MKQTSEEHAGELRVLKQQLSAKDDWCRDRLQEVRAR